MSQSIFDQVQRHGIPYNSYIEAWREFVSEPPQVLDKETRRKQLYIRYNFERSGRVHDSYRPTPAILEAVETIREPQVWMLITENWCGDSAYVTPVIAEVASLSDLIDLRIILRDTYPDIMDAYLTNGGRSIPKLVAFSEGGEELFQYGPRPTGAVKHREEQLARGKDKMEVIADLMKWYENGGWAEIDDELATILAG